LITTHLMELQLQQQLDTRTYLLEYENYSGSDRIQLYSNQGQYRVLGPYRDIVLIVPEDDEKQAA